MRAARPRSPVLLALLACALVPGLGGCIKRPPVARLPRPTDIGVAYVADSPFQKQLPGAPRELEGEVESVLRTRNLVGRAPPSDPASAGLVRLRDSLGRRRAAERLLPAPALHLLVEMQPSFYSQLSGRYKWNVYVKLSVWARGDPGSALEDSFEAPAFLLHDHEREAEAMADVAGTIARRAGLLLDTYFAGQPR